MNLASDIRAILAAHAARWRDRDNLDAAASILAGALIVLWGVYVAVLP